MSPTSPSSSSELQQTLSHLHQELARTLRIDQASRALLQEVLADIERLLGAPGQEAAAPSSRLESLAVSFEADHPGLAGAVRELIDLLARAGL